MNTAYGYYPCDAYHGGLMPPFATIDFGRRTRAVGVPGTVRFLCDAHGRGPIGWRDRYRMAGAPDPMSEDQLATHWGVA